MSHTADVQAFIDQVVSENECEKGQLCVFATNCEWKRPWDHVNCIISILENSSSHDMVILLLSFPSKHETDPTTLVTNEIIALDCRFSYQKESDHENMLGLTGASLGVHRRNSIYAPRKSREALDGLRPYNLKVCSEDAYKQLVDLLDSALLRVNGKRMSPNLEWVRFYQTQMFNIRHPQFVLREETSPESTKVVLNLPKASASMSNLCEMPSLIESEVELAHEMPEDNNVLDESSSSDEENDTAVECSEGTGQAENNLEPLHHVLSAPDKLIPQAFNVDSTMIIPPPKTSSKAKQSRKYMLDNNFRAYFSANYMDSMLRQNESQYTLFKTQSVAIFSWNVNGRQDPGINLSEWINPADRKRPAQIYVFAFQELELSLAGMATNKETDSFVEQRWSEQIESSAGGLLRCDKPNGFVKFRHRLSGIILMVYVQKKLIKTGYATDIVTSSVPTGMFNIMGNKGAVAIRMTLNNSWLCFLNCHLAAGEGNLDRRNKDFCEIIRRLEFEIEPSTFNRPFMYGNEGQTKRLIKVTDHDQIFVMGDMNYRVNVDNSQVVKQWIDEGRLQDVLKYDELRTHPDCKQIFKGGGYKEADITFMPTYKFDIGKCVYDTSEKLRVPSYTDRILWRGDKVTCESYRSVNEYCISDHKPIRAFFRIGVRRVIREAFMRTYEAIIRQEDQRRNMELPQAVIIPSSQELKFDEPIRFYERKRQKLELKNTGLCALKFRFIKDDKTAPIPDWLTITPEEHTVEVGEQCSIFFDICINEDCVYQMHLDENPLRTILVLKLIAGKDFFISIEAQFVPTCFGLPLGCLLKMGNRALNEYTPKELQGLIRAERESRQEGSSNSAPEGLTQSTFLVPKEILKLTEFLTNKVTFNSFLTNSECEFYAMRDKLNSLSLVDKLEEFSVGTMLRALLVILQAFPESVIPENYQLDCLRACNSLVDGKRALLRIPVSHQSLFLYLMAFLKNCLLTEGSEQTDLASLESKLVQQFAVVIFHNRNPRMVHRLATGMNNPYSLNNRESFIRLFVNTDSRSLS